jgi:hypothetical protein
MYSEVDMTSTRSTTIFNPQNGFHHESRHESFQKSRHESQSDSEYDGMHRSVQFKKGKHFEQISIDIISAQTHRRIMRLTCMRCEVVETLRIFKLSQETINNVKNRLDEMYGVVD